MKTPSEKIKKIIEKMSTLGNTIIAIRGDGFSGNLLGTIQIGEDGRDVVLRIKSCKCHVHVEWAQVNDVIIEEEDVGYGAEPVVRMIDKNKKAIVHFFYPSLTKEKISKVIHG